MCYITPNAKYEISEIDLFRWTIQCKFTHFILLSIKLSAVCIVWLVVLVPNSFENPAFLLQQSRTAFRKPFSAQHPAKLETPGCPGDLAGGGGGGHGGEGRGDRGGCCEQGCEAWSSWDSVAPRWILDRQELIGVASRDTFWKSFMQTLHFGRIWFPEIWVQPHLLSLRAGKCISVHCTAVHLCALHRKVWTSLQSF